jgi:ATP-dependent RNA helicase RhlE
MQFQDLGLAEPLLRALQEEGYQAPTPIQAQSIPAAMEGRDILGIAQTGTGKTAAFALPLLHRLVQKGGRPPRGGCRVLILSPTRELAGQIADSLRTYGRHLGFSVATVFGGVPHRPQINALSRGVDLLVATPGRLIDHLDTGAARLDRVEALVLDEADQMLDKGFWPAIRRIVPTTPGSRQTMLFSATMPDEIKRFADDMLRDPVRVAVAPVASTAERVDQKLILVEQSRKRGTLAALLREEGVGRALVFARTKHGADRVVKQLDQDGIAANAIHGDKSQGQRERALAEFRSGRAPILVATDIAARGIDVDGVTHVVQFDLPDTPESYVHRIGRTARAGASGIAIALCSPDERDKLRAVEKLIRMSIPAEDLRQDRSIDMSSPAPGSKGGKQGRGGGRGSAPQPQQQRRGNGGGGQQPPRQATARPGGEGKPQQQPRAPRQSDAPRGGGGETPLRRRDRSWREGDFRDGGAAPAFLRGDH